jgi:hypothetical protein
LAECFEDFFVLGDAAVRDPVSETGLHDTIEIFSGIKHIIECDLTIIRYEQAPNCS